MCKRHACTVATSRTYALTYIYVQYNYVGEHKKQQWQLKCKHMNFTPDGDIQTLPVTDKKGQVLDILVLECYIAECKSALGQAMENQEEDVAGR